MTDENLSNGTGASIPTTIGKSTTPEDLLKMYDEEPVVEAKEIDQEVDKQAKIAEQLPKKIVANEIVKKLEEKAPAQEGDSTETEEKDPLALEKKAFKARLDDADVDIPEEALITQTLPSGKEISFKVSDAVGAILQQEEFNRNMDHRVSKVTQREQTIMAQSADVVNKARSIASMAAQGDVVPAITLLAKMAAGSTGLDPIEYEKKFWGALEASKTLFTKMTPEQREVYFATRKAEELESTLKAEREQVQSTQGRGQIIAELRAIEQKYGITEQDVVGAFEVLKENVTGPGKKFATINDIMPKDIEHFIQTRMHVEKIDSAIEKVGLDKTHIDEAELFQILFSKTFGEEDFSTVEDIEYVLRQILQTPSQEVENLKRKVEKDKTASLQAQFKQGSSARKVNGIPDGYDDIEDVNFLYRPK